MTAWPNCSMQIPVTPPQRILVIKLRHHGDVLLTTPVIHALHHHYPTARIDMLLYHETLSIVANHPGITHLWSLDRSLHGKEKRHQLLNLYCNLRQQHYDWILHLSDQWNAALLTGLLKPKVSVGFDYPKRRNIFWRHCFSHLAPLAPSNSLHAVEQNLLALPPLGLEIDPADKRCSMAITGQDRVVIHQKLAAIGVNTPYIVVHPPARWFFKCWENDRFAQVIQTLANQGWPIIVSGGPSPQEMALNQDILGRIDSSKVHSLAGQLSLNSLAALIEGARLFIGVDSLPMHMAAAMQKDSVVLFGPSKLNEWHPWMTRYRLINAADFGPMPDPDAIDTQTDQRYLQAIPAEVVIDAVQALLDD